MFDWRVGAPAGGGGFPLCLVQGRRPAARRRPSGLLSRVRADCATMSAVAVFPSVKAGELLKTLLRHPLNYQIHRQRGSHRTLRADGRGQILFSYHEGATVPPGAVRKILVQDAGLTEDEALELL